MRRAFRFVTGAAALTLTLAGAARASEAVKRPVAPGVQAEQGEGFGIHRAALPGRLVAWATAGLKDGRREILLLSRRETPRPVEAPAPCAPGEARVAAPSAPPSSSAVTLLRLDTTGPGVLETLQADLPADTYGLDALDLDGDGDDEVLLSRPGRVETLEDDGTRRWASGPRLLMSDPGLEPPEPALAEPRASSDGGLTRLFDVSLLGAARFYGPSADHLSWDLLHEVALPMEASRDEAGLRLTGDRIAYAGRDSSGAQLFASGPQPFGRERLRTLLIAPGGPGPGRDVECWSRLARPEVVMEAAYLVLDGRPGLFVSTRPADKLSIFGEKLLRFFLLDEADRSRTGTAPILEAESHINLWQRSTPMIVDVDRDGRQDLVVGYWKGLKDTRVMLDAYLRKPDGSFARSPVTTGFDVERGDRSMVAYGSDLNGDGSPDLMVRAAGHLVVFPGSPAARGGRDLVEPLARWSVAIPGVEGHGRNDFDDDFDIQLGDGSQRGRPSFPADLPGRPRLADLDHDGVPEILNAGTGEEGAGLFQVIRLRRSH